MALLTLFAILKETVERVQSLIYHFLFHLVSFTRTTLAQINRHEFLVRDGWLVRFQVRSSVRACAVPSLRYESFHIFISLFLSFVFSHCYNVGFGHHFKLFMIIVQDSQLTLENDGELVNVLAHEAQAIAFWKLSHLEGLEQLKLIYKLKLFLRRELLDELQVVEPRSDLSLLIFFVGKDNDALRRFSCRLEQLK